MTQEIEVSVDFCEEFPVHYIDKPNGGGRKVKISKELFDRIEKCMDEYSEVQSILQELHNNAFKEPK